MVQTAIYKYIIFHKTFNLSLYFLISLPDYGTLFVYTNETGGLILKNLFTRKQYSFIQKILPFILAAVMLSGCGKNPEIENYKANMNQFFENIKTYDSAINGIDPNSETAVSDLLTLLDSMDNSFAQMASLEVPEGFPGVSELAVDASMYMSEAVSYFHQAYEGESFDASLEDIARQNYKFANVRLQYISTILHGNIPEEIFTYED